MALERIQKILAQAGIASRRKAEQLISEGEVTLNGKIAKLGDKATPGKDSIKVMGKLLRMPQEKVYLAFNKPKAVICSLGDPQNRPNLGDYLRQLNVRVYPIGRLDFNSEGLILLTNDGTFAEKVQKSDHIARVYDVKVKGLPDEEMLSRIQRGGKITTPGAPPSKGFKPHSVRLTKKLANKSVIQVVILGGGAIDVKAFFETRGFLVEKVSRTAFGHLTLKNLPAGTFKRLKATQALALLEQPELAMRRLEQEAQTQKTPALRKAPAPPKPLARPKKTLKSVY